MSGDPKAKLDEVVAEQDQRELHLRDGRTLTVTDRELVEIRASSGALELRIQLTDAGPILHMESVRLKLSAAEQVEIASKRIDIAASEGLGLSSGGEMKVVAEADVKVDATGEVRINGAMIYLN